VDQKDYLFFSAQKSVDIDFLSQSVDVIQELDSKKRKIRSFLYALEIMGRKVKNILRQIQEFLFPSRLWKLQDQVNSLQERLLHLENQNTEKKGN